jgi:hypothetical protein
MRSQGDVGVTRGDWGSSVHRIFRTRPTLEFGLSCDRSGVEFGLSCDRSVVEFGLSCDRSGVKFGLSCDRSGVKFGLSCDRPTWSAAAHPELSTGW